MKSIKMIAVAAASLAPAAAFAATVEISAAQDTVRVGETFDVQVVFQGDDLLSDFQTEVDFNDEVFGFVSGSIGSALGDTEGTGLVQPFGPGTIEAFASSNDGATTLAPLQTGPFSIATLTFEALAVGTSAFDLVSDFSFFSRPDFSDIEVTFTDASVSVAAIAPVPLPAGGALLLTGFLLMGGMRARRSAVRA